MNKGTAQLIMNGEVDETVNQANNNLKQSLTMFENLNEVFIREAKAINQADFDGHFYEAFIEKVQNEYEYIQRLNAENLDRINQLKINYDRLLYESSFQDYVYDPELIPMGDG